MTIEDVPPDERVRVDTSEDSSQPSGGVPGTDPLASHELGGGPPRIEEAEIGRLHAKLTSRLLGIESTAPRIGRFVLLDRLGEGGMGVVYSAYDDRLDRRVAIKLLHAELDGEGVHRRLVREAQAMAKLAHPNVATVFEVGEHNGRVFVAMELIKGATLRRWRAEATPSWGDIVATYVQAARGLAAAHAAGLVHRDFKPDNALVGSDGRVRVVDFGLVRSEVATAAKIGITELPAPRDRALGDHLTRTGSVMGTPAYMAPEQFLGEPVDGRTDQFAFCVSLWEALYGERPFAGTTGAALFDEVTRGRLRDAPPGAVVPRWLHAVLERGLDGKPSQRWASMDALIDQLARVPTRRRRTALVLGGVATAIAASVWIGGRFAAPDPCASVGAPFVAVWDESQAANVASALARTESPLAADVGARIHTMLAADVDSMAVAARESCSAHAAGLQSADLFDRRMACLDRRRVSVATLVERLASADAGIVEHAIDAVLSIAPVERCTDDALLADALAPPPEIAAEVGELRVRLAEANMLATLGLNADALVIAAHALDRAAAIDHAPLVAEAALATGEAAAADEGKRARDDFERAIWTAQRSGHDAVVLRGARRMVDLADHGYEIDPMPWARLAEATGARIGDPTSRASGLSTLGQARARVHDWAAAKEALERVVVLREQAQGPDAPQLAYDLPHLARAVGELGDIVALEQHLDRALAIAERTYGAQHPQVIGLLLSLADVAASAKQDDLALRYFELGLQGLVALERTDTMQAAWLLGGSAVVLQRRGRAAEAVPRFRASIAIKERELGAEHMQVVAAVRGLAFTEVDLGEYAEAERLARRAIVGMGKLLGEDHSWAAVPRVALGEALLGMGRREEGIDALEQALRGLGSDDVTYRARATAALTSARQPP